jgi:hypothetical protein
MFVSTVWVLRFHANRTHSTLLFNRFHPVIILSILNLLSLSRNHNIKFQFLINTGTCCRKMHSVDPEMTPVSFIEPHTFKLIN